MPEFTFEIESVEGLHLSDEQVLAVDAALRAAPCVLGPSVSANMADGSFGVSMTVVGPSHQHAIQRAFEAIDAAAQAAGVQSDEPERVASQREPAKTLA